MRNPTRLSENSIREFYEDGFTLVPDVLGYDQLEVVAAAFERLERRASGLEETCMLDNSQFVIGKGETDAGARIQRIVWLSLIHI